MFDRSVWSGIVLAALPTHSRRPKPARLALLSVPALAIVLALTGRILADGFDWHWGSEKVNASAYLRVSPADASQPFDAKNLQAEFDIFKNTQIQLLFSPIVLRAALKRPGVADLEIVKKQENPLHWLGRNLKINAPANSEIVQISLPGGDASLKELATLVNAVIDAYMAEIVDAERAKRDQRVTELKKFQMERSQELKDTIVELRKMAESLGTSDSESLTVREKIMLDELALYRTEFVRSQFELNRMLADLTARKAELDVVEQQPITGIEVQAACPNDAILNELATWLAKADEFDETAESNGKSPSALLTAKHIERAKKKYEVRLDRLKQDLAQKRRADIEREIKKLEAAIQFLTKQQEAAREELKLLRKEADRIGVSSTNMQMRRADIANREKSLDALTAEIEKLQIELHAPPRITVLEKAKVPE